MELLLVAVLAALLLGALFPPPSPAPPSSVIILTPEAPRSGLGCMTVLILIGAFLLIMLVMTS